jgi:integrase
MPRGGPSGEDFEYGGYWLGRESTAVGSSFYRYWYEHGRGRKVRRRSLGTADWEEAKRARFAGQRLLAFFGAEAKLGEATVERQREFMRDSDEEHDHSVSYIARNLSVLSAAKNHALREGLIRFAPQVVHVPATIADELEKDTPQPRDWIPSVKQIGELFDWLKDDPRAGHLFWYCIAALCTGARPAAILDLKRDQFDWEHRLVNLNPKGRRQEPRKFRPTIKAPVTLWGWVEHREGWDRWVSYSKKARALPSMRNMARRVREGLGWDRYVTYTLRHFVATQVYDRMRKAGIADAKEQAAYLLGHTGDLSGTTDRYIKYSADFMSDTVRAIDEMMMEIQNHTRRDLFAPKMHPNRGVIVVSGRGKNA